MADKPELTPTLRFPEFRDGPGWDAINGNELFDLIDRRPAPQGLPILAITQEHGAVPRDHIDYHVSVSETSIASYKEVQPTDFIISLRSFQGGIEYSRFHGICSPAYLILKRLGDGSDDYFRHLFKSDRFIQQLTRNIEGLRDGKMISYKQFSEQLLPTPTPAEQRKIAACLTSLDELLAAEGRKLKALRAHKKGLMQQLFPRPGETRPRLRFPEFRHKPQWSEKTLGSEGEFLAPLSGKTAADFDTGQARFIPYSNVFENTFIDKAALRFVNVRSGESQNAVQEGDLFFTVSSETQLDAGMSSVLLEDIYNCYLNSFCTLFRFHDGRKLNSRFAGYLFRSRQVRTYLEAHAQGAIRYNISRSVFRDLVFLAPSQAEQDAIADCLSSLDALIASTSQKLDGLRAHKKGLMQQLFPSPVGA